MNDDTDLLQEQPLMTIPEYDMSGIQTRGAVLEESSATWLGPSMEQAIAARLRSEDLLRNYKRQ